MVAFLHAADLHLGMRTTRFEPALANRIREARFTALDNILKKARALAVDFVLIAGDLFDDSTVDATTARRPFEMLESLPMPVYVLTGNHDPLVGGVWDRTPWSQRAGSRVRLFTEAASVDLGCGVTLFPCPVMRKTSMDDPAAWIARAPIANGNIRIGIAHGSLKTRPDLPLDDHLIDRHTADNGRLDYLALGHWHSRNWYPDRDGVNRTAYPGVHEPMRYQGTNDSTGWIAYGGANREEFLDSGKGEVLLVRIRTHGEPPQIEPVSVGHFDWREESRKLTGKDDLDGLIEDVANRENRECKLLKLRLSGVIDAETMLGLETLREILSHRYLLGEIDETALHLEPTEDEMRATARQGVLRRVLDKLREETASPEAAVRQVAERATLLLYQIAKDS